MIEIPPRLKVEPESTTHVEEVGKPQSCARRNATTTVDDLVDPLVGNTNRVGKITLAQLHWYEEFLEEHFAGVRGRSVRGNSNHTFSSMVVNDLNIFRSGLGPAEADPELIVDSHTVLTSPITLQRFQAIAWWYSEILDRFG
jgi:hypothetical protein